MAANNGRAGAPSTDDHTDRLLLCDCEGTMALDADQLRPGCAVYTNLCRKQADIVAELLTPGADGATAPVTIACGQEASTFADLAAEVDFPEADLRCVDIRDRAGWSDEGAAAGPKMAALLAEAALGAPAAPLTALSSEGVCLVIGPGDVALEAAQRLSDTLAVTCMLTETGDAAPRRLNDFPIVTGRLARATGRLGAFEVTVDAFAEMEPGGRGGLRFGPTRDGGRSQCDVILDLSGGAALFPAPEKRDGYVRADPRDPIAVSRAVFDAAQLIGEFEKPLYIRFEESLCAHSRARQPGCDRCLNVCPTGAITPNGDHVAIDPYICAGCGACAAVCPTGAATYSDPPVEHVARRMHVLVEAYRNAGGARPRLLIHDAEHGAEMIALGARFGRGLPADVIPLELVEIGGVSHASLLAALAMGFASVAVLAGPKSDRVSIAGQVSLASELAGGVGVSAGRIEMIEPGDPDALTEHLYAQAPQALETAPVLPLGGAREAVRLALNGLATETSPAGPISLKDVEMPGRAPYGAVLVNSDACTLCLSCIGLCPTGALADDPDKPSLRFQEDACIQCGICATACPETAITLEPRYERSSAALSFQTLHEEEPFACIECGKEFGVKSTIERITEKLAGKNWMYTNSDNAKLIQMCDDCRVKAQYHSAASPFQMGTPRKVRTTEDYLRERDENGDS